MDSMPCDHYVTLSPGGAAPHSSSQGWQSVCLIAADAPDSYPPGRQKCPAFMLASVRRRHATVVLAGEGEEALRKHNKWREDPRVNTA